MDVYLFNVVSVNTYSSPLFSKFWIKTRAGPKCKAATATRKRRGNAPRNAMKKVERQDRIERLASSRQREFYKIKRKDVRWEHLQQNKLR